MDPSEIISEEWISLSGFEAEFLKNCSVLEDLYGNSNLGFQSSAFWPTGFTADSFYFPSNNVDDPTDNFASLSMCCPLQVSEPAQEDDDKTSNLGEISAKRSSSSVEKQENKRNVKPKCSSDDDDSIASQEEDTSPKNNTDLKSNRKSSSERGAASDPQSLFARRRRGRINERLRMLQNLVPNGTKVDISTMLEEAVQYVKFLQLQIKLLSSDDL